MNDVKATNPVIYSGNLTADANSVKVEFQTQGTEISCASGVLTIGGDDKLDAAKAEKLAQTIQGLPGVVAALQPQHDGQEVFAPVREQLFSAIKLTISELPSQQQAAVVTANAENDSPAEATSKGSSWKKPLLIGVITVAAIAIGVAAFSMSTTATEEEQMPEAKANATSLIVYANSVVVDHAIEGFKASTNFLVNRSSQDDIYAPDSVAQREHVLSQMAGIFKGAVDVFVEQCSLVGPKDLVRDAQAYNDQGQCEVPGFTPYQQPAAPSALEAMKNIFGIVVEKVVDQCFPQDAPESPVIATVVNETKPSFTVADTIVSGAGSVINGLPVVGTINRLIFNAMFGQASPAQ